MIASVKRIQTYVDDRACLYGILAGICMGALLVKICLFANYLIR